MCAAVDSKTNHVVAIKKCKHIFQTRTLAKRTLREVRLLRLLEHENVIKLLSILQPHGLHTFQCIYAVFEIMETDLASIIKSGQKLGDQHVQYFTLQILRALDYIHSSKIVHRDLKPRNLLVNGDCQLKLADFGLARFYDAASDSKCVSMTEYVTTRWYRAPEILVGWRTYDYSVDMWATGCIIAELLGRKPLFPGSDAINQIEHICNILGKPEEEYIAKSRKAAYREILRNLQVNDGRQEFREIYRGANPAALELLDSLLRFDPGHRMSASAALMHPYMMNLNMLTMTKSQSLLSGEDSPSGRLTIDISDQFLFEDKKLPLDALRREIVRECRYYHDSDWDETTEEDLSAQLTATSHESGSVQASAASEHVLSSSALSPDTLQVEKRQDPLSEAPTAPAAVGSIGSTDPLPSSSSSDTKTSHLAACKNCKGCNKCAIPGKSLLSLGLLCHSGDSEEQKDQNEANDLLQHHETQPKSEPESNHKERRAANNKSDHKNLKTCLIL